MDASPEPVLVIVGDTLVPAERCTHEQLVHALAVSREANAFLRRKLEAVDVALRNIIDRCHVEKPLREQQATLQ